MISTAAIDAATLAVIERANIRSSCLGGEICVSPPCACAEDIARAALAAAERVATSGMSDLHAKLVAALDGHTEYSRDCHLSGQYLAELVMPIIHAHIAAAKRVSEPQPFNAVEQLNQFRKEHPAAERVAGEDDKSLSDFAEWCEAERYKIGAVDGYDYRSGEEYGLRCAQIEAERRAKAALALSPGKVREDS